MIESHYHSHTSRLYEMVVGLVALVVGVGGVLLAVVVLISVVEDPALTFEANVVLFLGGIGLVVGAAGLRLLTGKRRRDAGLLSPWALRLGGTLLLVGSVFLLLVDYSHWRLLELVLMAAAAMAAFVLANRREVRTYVAQQGLPGDRPRASRSARP